MDKTYNISLGGFAFNIEDNAYTLLRKYLKDISISIQNSPGVEEIIADIEYRMAELLREKMMGREVVIPSDIDYLIEILGQPEEFYNDEFMDDEPGAKTTYTTTSNRQRKLFRDPDDKMIGGVCSGVAHYLGVDSSWVRIIIVLLPFLDIILFGISTSTVVFVYLILWLVVPLAKTTSEKLQMRGEAVNIDSIKDFFGNSPEFRDNIGDFTNDARRVANKSGNFIGKLFNIFFKIVAILFIIFMIFIATTLLVGFIIALFGMGIAGFSLHSYIPYIFTGTWEGVVSYISLGLVMLIPAILLVLLALRLISSRYKVHKLILILLPVLWILGIMGLSIVFIATQRDFQRTGQRIETVNINSNSKTIILQREGMDDDLDWEERLHLKNGYFAIPISDKIHVKKTTSSYPYIELQISGKGKTKVYAENQLKDIHYNFQVQDSLILLDDFIYIKEGQKYRNQKLKTTLFLPDERQVVFRNIDDIESYDQGNSIRHDVDSEKIYTFENDLFKCLNCNELDLEKSKPQEAIELDAKEDSIIINADQNDTSNISISRENDSISG